MIQEEKRIQFERCQVIIYPQYRTVETWFADGAMCPGTRDSTMENVDYAKHLGYADGDTFKALYEHELLHTWLSISEGRDVSPTLWSVAHEFQGEGCVPYEQQLAEEVVVLSLQRALRQTGMERGLFDPFNLIFQPYRRANEFRAFLEDNELWFK